MILQAFFALFVLSIMQGQALKVMFADTFATGSCSSTKVASYPYAVDNVCTQTGASSFVNVDCTAKTLSTYVGQNCSGVANTGGLNCTSTNAPSVSGYSCSDVAASTLLAYQKGSGCNADGVVAALTQGGIVSTIGCITLSASSFSYKVTLLANNAVNLVFYNTSGACTGTISETITGTLDQCVGGIRFATLSAAGSFTISTFAMGTFALVLFAIMI